MTVDSYENDLRDALAAGNGPDVFLIHNSWLTKHQDKLSPAPDSVLTPKQVHVSRTGGGNGNGSLTIEAEYSVPVDLPGYSTTLSFHPSSQNKGVF